MEYNAQQTLALENNLHQLLIANAGSGKTAVLVEKFYNLITQRSLDDIQRVVAITFTRKAASEMQERIVRKINEQIENQAKIEKNSDYMKLVLLRERISTAKIQTIHSFCQEILSEYAVNIGFNPNLSVFEDYRFQKIYQEFFDDTLEDFMENDDNFKYIFEIISEYRFKEIVKMLVESNRTLIEIEEFYNRNIDDIIIEIKKNYIEIINAFFQIHKQSIESNTNLFTEKNHHKITELTQTLSNILLYSNENLSYIIELTKKLLNLKYYGNSKYLKAIIPPLEYNYLMDLLKDVKEIEENEQNYYLSFVELMRNIIRFTKLVLKKIENYKRRNSLITYNDMIYKVLDLFQNTDIVKKVSDKFDYFLIDEFQDTDENQFAIFRQLAFSDENQHKFLFLVGDPKQSIYGFRNADVRVINSASKLIESKNKELIDFANNEQKNILRTKIENQNYGKLELTSSYRLNIANTAFVNHLFSKIMNVRQQTGYEVAYNPLVYSRFNPYLNTEKIIISPELSMLHQFGSVKLLNTIIYPKNQINDTEENISDDNENNQEYTNQVEKERDNIEEASTVSDYIKYIINTKTKIFDVKLGKERPVEFSDIAILVRKNSLINNLTKALDRNSIPFALTGAEDFFETQEIIDIISFLRFINNPQDNYYLFATFKSYFFNIDDQTLYDVIYTSNTEGNSYWEIINNYCKNSNNNIDSKIQRAVSIVNEIMSKKEFYTVGDLINYILRITNYEQMFVNFSSRNLIYKNIEKFKNLVRQITATGTNSIGELLLELELIQESAEINSELEISTENAVNILTMHKAKGLEFPIVIIYHANFKPNYRVEQTFYQNKFPNFSFNLLTENERINVKTPLFTMIKRRQQLINDEEEKRLFYVAATRAKDLLVISSLLEPDNKDDYSKSMKYGFGKYYFPLFYEIDEESGKILFQPNSQEILLDLQNDNFQFSCQSRHFKVLFEDLKIQMNNEQLTTLSLSIPIEIIDNFRYSEPLDYKSDTKSIEPIILLQNVEFPKQDEHISATSLQLFMKNKRNYFLRYITNLNLDYLDLIDKKAEISPQKITGKERGTIIHNSIANISKWYGANSIDQDKLKAEIIRNLAEVYDENLIEQICLDIQEEINRVFEEDFIKERIKYILQSKFEIPFYYYWDGRYVDIIIDLLYQDENGSREVWDWKNNEINSDEEYQNAIEYYSIQMKFYSFILSRQYPKQNEFVARLFFTRLAKKDKRWMKVFRWSRNDLELFGEEIKETSSQMYDTKSINFD